MGFERISQYCATAIPPHLEVQVRTLLSAEWPDPEENDTVRPLTDPLLHPTYFLLADDDQLLSYARTIWARVSHRGQTFKLYGLGDVVTNLRFRRQGYGSRIVEEATTYITSDREADAALLLTEPNLEAFYRRSNWEGVPGLRVMTDEDDECRNGAIFPMMLFLSAKAHTSRQGFVEDTLVLPGDEW